MVHNMDSNYPYYISADKSEYKYRCRRIPYYTRLSALNMATVKITNDLSSLIGDVADDTGKKLVKLINENWSNTKALPNAPPGIDTGTLSKSIVLDVDKIKDKNVDIITISTNLDYAYFLEFGTSAMPAHPFLRPALNKAYTITVDEFKKKL